MTGKRRTNISIIIGICALLFLTLLPVQAQAAISFEKDRPLIDLSGCSSTYHRVKLKWEAVEGAEEYQVYRSGSLNGNFEEFEVTKDITLKKQSGGKYYYKVRSVKSSKTSLWSETVCVFCAGGKVEEMYYDDNGFTHFRVKISNRTKYPIYFYGQGMYNMHRDPQYIIERYDVNTKEEAGYPYPLTAVIAAPVNGAVEAAPKSEDQTIDFFVPEILPMYGESGMRGDVYGYKLRVRFHPQMDVTDFTLSMTDSIKNSRVSGRWEK